MRNQAGIRHSTRFPLDNNFTPSLTVKTCSLPSALRNLEMNYIENALRETKGKVQPEVFLPGISRFTLVAPDG